MQSVQRCAVSVAVLLVFALPLGCGKKSTAPQSQPVVTNNPDDFTYQASNIQAKTGVETYAWHNSGARASVNQSSTIFSGLATLTIEDADGTQVYARAISETGIDTTAGNVGTWIIRIDYAHASGSVNFRVRKI